ncbi:MAG: cytochrome c [bacterium]|nr:cytochrome c [bacterium]
MYLRILSSCILLLLVIIGCRGQTSNETPFHYNPNMDTQIKYKPYRASDFFADKRDMRPLVEGVVARGYLKEDDHFYRGVVDGKLVTKLPDQIHVDRKFLERGQERFNIYCAPCHSQVGDGGGMVGVKLPIRPTTFYSDYMYKQPIGHFFQVITDGIRTMPAYSFQVPENDRWAIAAYIRALQLSQNPELKHLAVVTK